ncbi:endonuclease-reverse transcriptase [Elysia marginata]|uniref:Endonuclease-reverse transcriptase n=1 Tax=Elysia marginata TaxID=1093978 RepID=A0AAV4GTG9_9GAST|nr:endonuclease-reverse transcriptase [Elysia marginata]
MGLVLSQSVCSPTAISFSPDFYKQEWKEFSTKTNQENKLDLEKDIQQHTTYTLNQVIEKSNEYNLPLCVGFIDYEKAFDSVEHFAIFDALRQININEKYVNILENIYQNATAKVHIDNMESELFPIKRGVRQGDPISPKLFTAAIEMIFRKAELKHGLNIDGETLTNLTFADDVALVTEDTKSMEEQLNNLNKISIESGLKMHKGKTKYMINFESHENIQIDKEKIEKVPNYKYLGQTRYLKETTKE